MGLRKVYLKWRHTITSTDLSLTETLFNALGNLSMLETLVLSVDGYTRLGEMTSMEWLLKLYSKIVAPKLRHTTIQLKDYDASKAKAEMGALNDALASGLISPVLRLEFCADLWGTDSRRTIAKAIQSAMQRYGKSQNCWKVQYRKMSLSWYREQRVLRT